jgi:uncharacterized protein YcbK (DUF882 family)
MKITKNFSKHEFESKDGATMPNDVFENVKQLAANLQALRDELGISIKINSGYRSPEYNKKVGGAKNSQHLLGKAADMKVEGKTPKEIADLIEKLIKAGKMKEGGIGIYNTFTHYDFRGTKARWDFRT